MLEKGMGRPLQRFAALFVLAGAMLTADARASGEGPAQGQAVAQGAETIPAAMKAAIDRTDVTIFGIQSTEHLLGFSDPKPILQALHDAGKKYVAIDLSPDYQPLIDSLAKGRIDRNQFLQEYADYTTRIGTPPLYQAEAIPQGADLAEIVQQAAKLDIGIIAAGWAYESDIVRKLPESVQKDYDVYTSAGQKGGLSGYVNELCLFDPDHVAQIMATVKAYRAGDVANDTMFSGTTMAIARNEREIHHVDRASTPPLAIFAETVRTGALKAAAERHYSAATIVHIMANDNDLRENQAETAALDKIQFPTVLAPQTVNYFVASDGRWHEDPRQAEGARTTYRALQKHLSSAPVAIIGDTDHAQPILKLLASDEVMGAISASGKKYIGLEGPPFQQKLIDQLADGKITSDDFVALEAAQWKVRGLSPRKDPTQEAREQAKLILQARKWNLRVINFDSAPDDKEAFREYNHAKHVAEKIYDRAVKKQMAGDGTKPEFGPVIPSFDSIDGPLREGLPLNRTLIKVMRQGIREQQQLYGIDPARANDFVMFIGAAHCVSVRQALAEKGLDSTTTYLFRDEVGLRGMENDMPIDIANNSTLQAPAEVAYLVGDHALWHAPPSIQRAPQTKQMPKP